VTDVYEDAGDATDPIGRWDCTLGLDWAPGQSGASSNRSMRSDAPSIDMPIAGERGRGVRWRRLAR
jgi:hypothetical protein